MNGMVSGMTERHWKVTVELTEEERHHTLSAMLGGTVTTACPICARVIEKLRRVATPESENTDG